MKARIELSRDELNALQYPVVVERWHKALYGKNKRLFLAEFGTEEERQAALQWYQTFREWYLSKGTPEFFIFRDKGLSFAKRLISFFGTI